MKRNSFSLALLFGIWATLMATGFAQSPGPLEPSDTSSPGATLKSFLSACNEFFELTEREREKVATSAELIPIAERMFDCLDRSGIPDELRDSSGIESAVYLKEVLDRTELPDDQQLSQTSTLQDDGTTTRWRIPGTRLAIAKMQSGPNVGQFMFTAETVRSAAKLYSAVKSQPYRTSGMKVSPGLYDRYTALTKRQPQLAADTSSPRGTLTLFLNTANEIFDAIQTQKYVDRSDPKHLPNALKLLGCLDLSELPEYSRDFYGSEAAVCLKEVLDRVKLPPPEEIPGAEDVKPSDGEKATVRWQIPNTQLTIAKMSDGPRRGEYLFTAGTVKRVFDLYHKVKSEPYQTDREVPEGFYAWYLSAPATETIAKWVEAAPPWIRSRTAGLAIWQWIGLFFSVSLAVIAMAVSYRFGRSSQETSRPGLWQDWVTMLFPIVGVIIPLLFMHVVHEYLTMRGTALYVAEFGGNLVFLLALMILILGISRRVADSVVALPSIEARGLDAALTRILCRLVGIIVATIVFLEGGRYLGFPITTLLASAGISGLAIALSAQGMIKGLFGTITILLDKPFQVGERIIVNGHDGFVEEIGLRSTKIRTFLSNHLISIPNDQMADAEVENIGRRQHIQRAWDMHIPLDTPREKVESAVSAIRDALVDHEGMDPAFPPRVFFNAFNADSFNIRVHYWYHPPNLWEFQAFSEQINLKIFRLFEEQGIQFSLPLRHTFWKHDDRQGPLEVRVENVEDDSSHEL